MDSYCSQTGDVCNAHYQGNGCSGYCIGVGPTVWGGSRSEERRVGKEWRAWGTNGIRTCNGDGSAWGSCTCDTAKCNASTQAACTDTCQPGDGKTYSCGKEISTAFGESGYR